MNCQNKELEKERQRLLLDITPIDSFSGKYRWASNFYPSIIWLDDLMFGSVEAGYQAAKTLDLTLRLKFTSLTSREAKKLGNELELREDWENVKVEVMRSLLLQKFSKAKFDREFYDRDFWRKLEATRPRMLVEGNHWHDTFWGVCNGKCKQGPHKPYGENQLGQLLMEIRDGLVHRTLGR